MSSSAQTASIRPCGDARSVSSRCASPSRWHGAASSPSEPDAPVPVVGPGGSVEVGRDEHARAAPSGRARQPQPIRRGALYNIFAGHVTDQWVDESWAVPSGIDELLAGYRGWNPALLEMLGQVRECFKWGIRDRDPLPRWTEGAVTLLGDAAHPMMPTLAQARRNPSRTDLRWRAIFRATTIRARPCGLRGGAPAARLARGAAGARAVSEQPKGTGAAAAAARLDFRPRCNAGRRACGLTCVSRS